MQPADLLQLETLAFLQALVDRYPETRLLAGPAEASPEGNQTLKAGAWAYKVFGASVAVDPTAIEADRTFLGLLMLKAALTGDKSKYPHLSETAFVALQHFTRHIIQTEADLEFCLYALACNDLGKTHTLVTEHARLTGHTADDHDQRLYELIRLKPDLFPGLKRLMPAQQTQYLEGLGANLNLGQYVQGENLPYNLLGMQAISPGSRNLRLITELYDFAGVTGHVNPHVSLMMNDDNCLAFALAMQELMREPVDRAYERYIRSRSARVGIDTSTPEGFAQGRITTLARAFTGEQGQLIQAVWTGLAQPVRETLVWELNVTGLDGYPGILLYYSPALIANAVKATGDFGPGLTYALTVMARVYSATRRTACSEGNGVITVNVAALADQSGKDPAALGNGEWKMNDGECSATLRHSR